MAQLRRIRVDILQQNHLRNEDNSLKPTQAFFLWEILRSGPRPPKINCPSSPPAGDPRVYIYHGTFLQ